MSFRKLVSAGLLATTCIGGALACGPFFPWQLLDSRDETMAEPIGLGFTFEASRLVAVPGDGLRAIESYDWTWASDRNDHAGEEAIATEKKEVRSGAWRALTAGPANDGETLVSKLAAARDAKDGEAARLAGAGLPVAVLEYIAGAVEFRAGRYDAAARYFEAIDRLPLDQRHIRKVAATYMQGRIHQQLGAFGSARTAFQAARRYAQEGAPDPMGLAVASLGEEARVDLAEAGLVEVPWAMPSTDLDDGKITGLIANAVRLYAEQAARGSKMALLSLREVAGALVARENELRLGVADPLVRRLLISYVVARDGQSLWDEGLAGSQDPIVARVIEAVLTHPAPVVGYEIDRLAALAYQAGRYELAEKLISASSQPLGLWVRAKLALRRGDRAGAIRDWTAAFTAIDAAGSASTLDEPAQTRLRGELAVARLSQGEYRDSLRLLFPTARTYWGDVSYVAERVLTVDELKAFVDGLPPVRDAERKQDDNEPDFRSGEKLRDLLARRLMREGRFHEARAYFPPADGTTVTENDADRGIGDVVRAYVEAYEAAKSGWPFDWPWQRTSRAEALFKLATLARRRGMEMMGTEGPPDLATVGGAFAGGFGQSGPQGVADSPSALIGPDEAARFAASAPKASIRFHYRVLATDHALAAADLLPQRSQAYAATLCWAARYAGDSSDQARVEAIYRRYVATGAYQAWASRFGRICPEPEFTTARTFWSRRIAAWPTQIAGMASRHVGLAIAAALGSVVLLGAMIWVARSLRRRSGLTI
jgi:tetratricopeptide (TPR) repeat protein